MTDQRRLTGKATLPPKRSARLHRSTDEMAGAACRFIRSIGYRVTGEDEDGLVHLQRLEEELRVAWVTAITGLREADYSDAEIGEVLGVTRQAVQQKWPRDGGVA